MNSCKKEGWNWEDKGRQDNTRVDSSTGNLVEPFTSKVFGYLPSVRHHAGGRNTMVRESRRSRSINGATLGKGHTSSNIPSIKVTTVLSASKETYSVLW